MLLTEATRLPHLLYLTKESGTKAEIPTFDAVTNATIAVDTIYDLRLVQPNIKNKGREARRFLRL